MTLQELAAGQVPPFLSADQVVALGVFPGVGRAGIYQAIREGQLPHVRIGKRVLIPAEELRRLAGLGADA